MAACKKKSQFPSCLKTGDSLACLHIEQTETGCQAVSVVCPFAELSETEGYRKPSIFPDEERRANSLTRKVTNRLMTNVAAIKREIDNGNLDSLADYDNPISANFLEALNGMIRNPENTTVEFTAEWSPAVKRNRCKYNRISMTNDYCGPIQTVISRHIHTIETRGL